MQYIAQRVVEKIRHSNILQAVLLATIVVFPIVTYIAISGRTMFPVNILQDCCGWSYAQDEWVPKNTQISDTVDYILPMSFYTHTTMKSGEFPLWNPYLFGGSEFFSNSQSAVLQPLNLLYLFVGPLVAHTISVLLSIYVMVVFSYLLLKRLGVRTIPSVVGAIGYISIPWVMFWLEWGTIGWIMAIWPALLYFLYGFRQSGYKNPIQVGCVTLILGVQILFGHLQFALFSFVIVAVWWAVSLLIDKGRRKIILLSGLLSCGIALMIGSVGLVNTISMSRLGHRSETQSVGLDTIMKYDILPQAQPIIVAEDANLYIPNSIEPEVTRVLLVVGIVLVGVALYKRQLLRSMRNHSSLIFIGIFFVGFGFAASLPIFKDIFQVLPVGKGMLLHYFIALSIMAMPFIGALVFNKVLGLLEAKRPSISRSMRNGIVAAIVIICGVSVALAVKVSVDFNTTKQPQVIGIYAVVTLVGVFVAYLLSGQCRKLLVRLTSISLMVIMLLQYWTYMYAVIPVPKKSIYTVGNALFACIEQDATEKGISFPRAMSVLSSNTHMIYGIGVLNGYDSLYPMTDKEFHDARNAPLKQRQVYGDNALLDVNFSKRELNTNLGINYLILYRADSIPTGYSPICHDTTERYQVYRADEIAETIYFAKSLVKADESEQIGMIRDNSLPIGVVATEGVDTKPLTEGKVLQYAIHGNTIDASVSVPSGQGLLFIGESYNSGWRATVDGKEVTIQKADYKFMALPVAAGRHTIKLTFMPQYFIQSIAISVLGIIGLIVWVAYLLRLRR